MQLWLREAVNVLRYPTRFFRDTMPRSPVKAALFLIVSGVLVSLTHYVFQTAALGAEWWMQSAFVAGPVLIIGTAVASVLLHIWLYLDRQLGERNILFDRLPVDYDGTYMDTFIVFSYSSAVPALLLWAPLLIAPSVPALIITLLIGAYTGYVAGYGFSEYHGLETVTEDHEPLLSAEVLGGAVILFSIELIVLARPALTLQMLQGLL